MEIMKEIEELQVEITRLDNLAEEKFVQCRELYKLQDWPQWRDISYQGKQLRSEASKLSIRLGKLKSELDKQTAPQEKKERYITCASYERALKRTERAVLRNMGY